MSKRRGIANTLVADATAKALMHKYPNVEGETDIYSSRWCYCLFTRINFVKRWKTSSKRFRRDIVWKAEKYNIPPVLIINIVQTPLNYVSFGNETL